LVVLQVDLLVDLQVVFIGSFIGCITGKTGRDAGFYFVGCFARVTQHPTKQKLRHFLVLDFQIKFDTIYL
jgi:hypothetical protein